MDTDPAKAPGELPFETIETANLVLLVDRFYARVRLDPLIGPVFNNAIADWPEHMRLLAEFWSSVMLRTGTYRGNPMAKHRLHPIHAAHFDRWLALWEETTGELYGTAAARKLQIQAQRIGRGLSLGLGLRPGRDAGIAIVAGTPRTPSS